MARRVWISLGLLLILLCVVALVVLRSSDESPPPAELPQPVRVGYIPVTHCLPLYVGVDKGIFADEGLDLELTPLAGGATILEALAAGEIEVGFSNVVSPILGRARGIPFIAITGGPVEDSNHRDHAILVSEDSSISSPADLAGKAIALNTRQNIDHLMLLLLLDKYGLAEDDVTFLEVPFPRMLASLAAGNVDAAAAAEPFITLGQEAGGVKIVSWNYTDVREETYVASYVTTEGIVERYPSLPDRFADAIARATQMVAESPQYSRSVLATFTRLPPEIASKVALPRFEPHLDRDNLSETARLLREKGFLESKFDVNSLLLSE